MDNTLAFRLHFTSDRSQMMTINVPHADDTLDGAEVAAAMTAIVDSQAVQSTRGRPQTNHSAYLVNTESTHFNIV